MREYGSVVAGIVGLLSRSAEIAPRSHIKTRTKLVQTCTHQNLRREYRNGGSKCVVLWRNHQSRSTCFCAYY